MSRKISNINRLISKCTASILVVSCIILSSPGVLLANTTTSPDVPTTDTSAQAQINSPSLDVQAVQANNSSVDSTTLTPSQSVNVATDPNTDNSQAVANANIVSMPDLNTGNVSPSDASITPNTDSAQPPVSDNNLATQQNSGIQNATTADPAASNDATGNNSQNSSSTDINNNTDVTNQNYAQVFNDSFLQANTGANNANYNTGSGIVTTQKAEGNGQLVNVINKNAVQTGGSAGQSSSATNQNTGSGSDNSSQTNINNELTVKNVNEANVINRVTADISSGKNNSNFNTGHGMITTGAANLGLNFFSLANANLFGSQKFYANLQNIYNDYTGNVDLSAELNSSSSPLSNLLINASNNSTGANSSNQSIANVNDQTSITNQNTGHLNNEIDATVVSGQNKANYNTGTGSIVSGQVNSSVNVLNFLNSNITSGNWMVKTLNVFGDWKGDLKLPSMPAPDLSTVVSPSNSNVFNSNTGSGSNNSVNANTSDSTTLTNNNSAGIENNVTMRTDSGTNDASYNGGSGIVKIGVANAETNEMNVANLNVTGNSWWLIVVNRFGNWNGTAVGSPEAVAIKTTGISTVLTPQQSGVNVTNNPTGADSNNSAGVNINHTTDITNTNQADIVNNLNIQAISGGNEAQRNSGHGYIETGDIRGVNNIMNFANANITVGNWVVVVVNVFGNWDGNLIFSPNGGTDLPIGGSLQCPVFNPTSSSITNTSNNTTGSNSQNNSSSATDTNNSATNNNNANLNNTTSASSTTGQNNSNYNTGNGNVSTGQAQAGSSVNNQANSNSTNTGQSSSGGTSSSQGNNGSTGSGSTNDSSATNNNNSTQTNENNITVNNNVSGSNNTGQNSSNYNTGNGSVDTSWANTFLDLRNQVNDNKISIGDLNADFNQEPIAPEVRLNSQMTILLRRLVPG